MADLSKLQKGVNTVADIASNFGVIGGVAGGAIKTITGLFGHKKSATDLARENAQMQYEYQSKLNAQQQEYAEKNAELAYNRERELSYDLARDSPLLQKQGLQNAGLSQAFSGGQPSTVGAASVGQASPASGGSVNVPNIGELQNAQQQVEQNNVGMMLNAASIFTQNKKAAAETENQEIKNMYEERQQIADLKQKATETHNKELLNEAQEMENSWSKKYGERIKAAQADEAESRAVDADNQAAISAIIRRYKDQHEFQDLANKRMQYMEMLADVNLKRAQRKQIFAEIRKINQEILNLQAQKENTEELTEGQKLQNKFDRDTLEDRKATIHNQRLRSWLDAQPRSLQEALMADADVRSTFNKMRAGEPLDAADWSRIASIAGYEKAGDLVNATGSFIGGLGKRNVKRTIVEHRSNKK